MWFYLQILQRFNFLYVFHTDFPRYFFFTFLILANCVRDESSADSSNGSDECGTYRFLCTQMKILQLLEFGYIFCLFFADACSDLFTILGLWVLGLAVSNINESQLQTYES